MQLEISKEILLLILNDFFFEFLTVFFFEFIK